MSNDAAVTERSLTATKQTLVARLVGIVSAAWRVSSICSCSSSTDGSSTDTHRYSTGYGCATIDATINATAIDASTTNATVINAAAGNRSAASSIGEGIS